MDAGSTLHFTPLYHCHSQISIIGNLIDHRSRFPRLFKPVSSIPHYCYFCISHTSHSSKPLCNFLLRVLKIRIKKFFHKDRVLKNKPWIFMSKFLFSGSYNLLLLETSKLKLSELTNQDFRAFTVGFQACSIL